MAGSSRGWKRAPGRGSRDPVDAERPPVRAPAVPRHQVPAAADVDERVRLDLAARALALAGLVAEAQALVVAARRGDQRQHLRVGGRPAPAVERHRRGAERLHAPAQVRGQHLLELDERAHRRLLDARSPTRARRCAARRRSRSPRRRRAAAAASRCRPRAGSRPPGRSATRPDSRARAGGRCRAGPCGRTPRGGRRARRRASRAGPAAATAGSAGGSRWSRSRIRSMPEIEDRS